MKVLVTGGAGYIGSTVVTALEVAGHEPVVIDSLLTGQRVFVQGRPFYEGDIADRPLVARIVAEHPDLGCTIHLAARTDVVESMAHPGLYYRDNFGKTMEFVNHLSELGLTRLVFSSSAAVYGDPEFLEVAEGAVMRPTSPYGRTKLFTELALEDLARATSLRAIMLRYFNPVGADPDLRTGPHAPEPTVVLGRLLRVVAGLQDSFSVLGTDWPTRDGTAMRDFVHVWDVARAHVAAVDRFEEVIARAATPAIAINIGTGRGTTVRELVAAVERVVGRSLPVIDAPMRDGDIVGGWAKVDLASQLLGWSAGLDLDAAIRSALAWDEVRERRLGYH